MKYFLGRSRYVFLAVLVGFSSLALSLSSVLTSTVSAASIYDATIRPIDELVLVSPDNTKTVDVTSNWQEVFASVCPAYVTSFLNARDNGGHYSVSYFQTTGNTKRFTVVWAQPDQNVQLVFRSYGASNRVADHQLLPSVFNPDNGYARVTLGNDNVLTGECGVGLTHTVDSSTFIGPTTEYGVGEWCSLSDCLPRGDTYEGGTNGQRPFLSTFPVIYPSGYAGQLIPGIPKIDFFPKILYLVTGYNITADYVGDKIVPFNGVNLPCTIDQNRMYLTYSIFQSGEIIDAKTMLCDQTYSYTLPGYDEYQLFVSITDSSGNPISQTTDYNLLTTSMSFTANGSSFIAGNDGSYGECSVVDGILTCEQLSPYEDCSTYGTDIVGGFQCVIDNALKWFKATLFELFVPRNSFFSNYMSQFADFLNTKLGFVYSSIAAVFGILGGVITGAASTSCTITPPGTLFGSPVSFDVCSFQSVIGNTPFIAIQTLVIGVTVVTLVFAGIRKYQEVVDKR